ncbi:MAG: DUF1499 domain-containing protein [Alphaproteobacteria bacterium]|nr:DUF1499 domain-containing protein [Alphaproteobacteria bacterium]
MSEPPFLSFESLRLTPKPNQCLAAPEGLCAHAKPHLIAPLLTADAGATYTAALAALTAQPRMTILAADSGARAIEAVQRSALFQFPDYVSVRIVPAEGGGASLAIYSRSKYGYSDLGVNKARVERLLAAITTRLATR